MKIMIRHLLHAILLSTLVACQFRESKIPEGVLDLRSQEVERLKEILASHRAIDPRWEKRLLIFEVEREKHTIGCAMYVKENTMGLRIGDEETPSRVLSDNHWVGRKVIRHDGGLQIVVAPDHRAFLQEVRSTNQMIFFMIKSNKGSISQEEGRKFTQLLRKIADELAGILKERKQ